MLHALRSILPSSLTLPAWASLNLPALGLFAAVALAPAADGGDLRVIVRGVVASGTAPPSGPLVGAAVGDPVTLTFEVLFPTIGNGSTRRTWMDNPTFMLTVGSGTEVHRYTVGGIVTWTDGGGAGDGIALNGEALATFGMRLNLFLLDSTGQVFSTSDPLLLEGTYGPSDFDTQIFTIQSPLLVFAFQSLEIEALDAGVSYCGPAVPNSSGASATIRAIGTNRLQDERLRVSAESLPLNASGYFLASMDQGVMPMAGGSQGTLCLGGSIGRYVQDIQSSGATGTIALDIDSNAIAQPMGTFSALAGQTWNFQCWFRDANPSVTSNFTDGVAVTFL